MQAFVLTSVNVYVVDRCECSHGCDNCGRAHNCLQDPCIQMRLNAYI